MTLDEMSREKYGFREKTETDISKINTIQYCLTFVDSQKMLNVGEDKYWVTLNEIQERKEPNESQ